MSAPARAMSGPASSAPDAAAAPRAVARPSPRALMPPPAVRSTPCPPARSQVAGRGAPRHRPPRTGTRASAPRRFASATSRAVTAAPAPRRRRPAACRRRRPRRRRPRADAARRDGPAGVLGDRHHGDAAAQPVAQEAEVADRAGGGVARRGPGLRPAPVAGRGEGELDHAPAPPAAPRRPARAAAWRDRAAAAAPPTRPSPARSAAPGHGQAGRLRRRGHRRGRLVHPLERLAARRARAGAPARPPRRRRRRRWSGRAAGVRSRATGCATRTA